MRPKLVAVGGDTFNFGTTEVGQEFEHKFIVKNEGDMDAPVSTGPPSCVTCTSFTIDKQVLKPGESLTATVKWHIKNETAEFRQFAPIEVEGGDVLKLHVVGKVAKRIIISPSTVWSLGEVTDGEAKTFKATIYSEIVDAFQIESLQSSSPAVSVQSSPMSPDKLQELKARCGFDLHVTLSNDIPIGDFASRVTINVLGPKPIALVVNVTAKRSGPVQIFGANWNDEFSLFNGGSFDPKQEFVARLNLFVRGVEGELRVESLKCRDNRFSVEIKPDPKFQGAANGRRKYDLFIKVAPSQREVLYNPKTPLLLSIVTNQPSIGTIELKWRSSALP